jgi:hypothetical protein
MSIGPYLYRGTTAGWPGNSVLQEERITCTSTDPLVATLFAIECRNHGHAVILAATKRDDFLGYTAPPNYFFDYESSVNLYIPPLQFAAEAGIILEVDRALAILRELGFEELPVRISSKEMLRDALWQSYVAGQRLSVEQLDRFNSRMLGVEL